MQSGYNGINDLIVIQMVSLFFNKLMIIVYDLLI
jgi:hypothetical protein